MTLTSTANPKDAMYAIVVDRRRVSPRALAAGLVGALLLHLFGWLAFPDNMFESESVETVNPYREYSIELEMLEEEIPEQIYTQTNPDAPENEPDETNRYGARSQQAANPDIPDEIDPENRPARESEREFETDQFLTGELDPMEFAPPPPSTPGEESVEQSMEQQALLSVVSDSSALAQKTPLSGELEEEEELPEEGIADFLRRETEEDPNELFEESLGKAEQGEGDGVDGSEVAVVVPQLQPSQVSVDGYPSPRPRRKLPRLPSSATSSLSLGVVNSGKLAMDARASELGEYAERMIETVSTIWDSIVRNSSNTDIEGKVTLQFMLTKDGYITDLERLDEEAKVLSVYECRQAILQGQPYGEWTDSMVRMHGDQKQIRFVFYYQQ